jgi:hypothetical protein
MNYERLVPILLNQIDHQRGVIERLSAENSRLRASVSVSAGESVQVSVTEQVDFQDFTEASATRIVAARAAGCADKRTQVLLEAAMTHIHNLVREVEPTEAEWIGTIDFLTKVN